MNNKKGAIFAIISAVAFSLGGLLVKLIPWSSFAIISGRCIFSSIFIILFFIITKQKLVINKTTIFGTCLVMLNMITYVTANKLTTAANTIVLEYTAPVYIIIFNTILFHQKPTKLKIFTVLAVLVGIVMVMAGSLNVGSVVGNLIAAANGVIYALQIMSNDFKGGDSLSSTLMGHIICLFLGLPWLLAETNFNSSVLTYLILLGIFQAGLGYLMLALSTKYTDSLTVSLISFIEPILNPILVVIFYGEKIGLVSIVGIIIVLVAIFYYNYKTNKNSTVVDVSKE